MVGHLLEYHPAVTRLKELVDSDELGRLYYIYGNRLNLGKLRADENALWSLGAHDVSVALHLIGEEPDQCLAHGASYVREGVQDVVFCYLRFPSGIVAHLHLSWLDPHKERRITVVGASKMATFDDMLIEGKLTIYDKGFDEDTRSWGEYIARSGDTFSPQHSQRRAAAHRVRALRPLRAHRRHPPLGRPQRAARRARARGAAALARRLSATPCARRGGRPRRTSVPGASACGWRAGPARRGGRPRAARTRRERRCSAGTGASAATSGGRHIDVVSLRYVRRALSSMPSSLGGKRSYE